MHGCGEPLVMPQHKLAQVLPRLANNIGDIGQADIVWSSFHQSRTGQRRLHIIQRAQHCFLRSFCGTNEVKPEIARLTQSHHGVGAAVRPQALHRFIGIHDV